MSSTEDQTARDYFRIARKPPGAESQTMVIGHFTAVDGQVPTIIKCFFRHYFLFDTSSKSLPVHKQVESAGLGHWAGIAASRRR